ncbi:MAG: DsbC family protein [Gammaproteobacteria bacterium]
MIREILPASLSVFAAALGLASIADAPAQSTARPTTAPAPAAARPASGGTTLATRPDPRAELSRRMPGSKPEDFRPAPIAGLYEYAHGADIVYVTADGRHVIDGDVFELASQANLTERRRREARLALIGKVPEADMVIFGPRTARYTVTVFTDVDCTYCRKLHSEIAQYNDLGIRVRYLFYPRSGPDTESWGKAEAVWCSRDRNDAMTRAKKGETVKSTKCDARAVKSDYELGQDVGLRGTPAIILPDGELLGGYLPPAMLIKQLQGPPTAAR